MKNCLLIIFLFATVSSGAQSYAGITGKPDTSYSMYSAWTGTKKSNPEATQVTEPAAGTYREEKNIVYASTGKRALQLDIFRPVKQSAVKKPAIMIIHGGGWRTGNRTQHHTLAKYLAGMGYTCFTPEYRLSTEALFPAAVYDLKAAVRWVKEHAKEYGIDSSRICAAGFSAGGELAAFLGATGNMPLFEGNSSSNTGTNVHAVIDIDGILSFTHPESGEGDDSKRTSAATYWFGYPRKGNEKLWETGSALSYAGPYTPPTLFLNSSVDRMHAGREDFIAILNQYHIYSELHSFLGAPHAFCLFEPWFTPTLKYIDAFLQKIFP